MRNNFDSETVLKIVEEILSDRLGSIEIKSVEITPDVDFDGDDILRVEVVFLSETKWIPPEATRGLIRRIRPKLSDVGEYAFPIMSFIADSEMKRKETAA